MSNPIKLYKRPIKSQGKLRVAENRTNMNTTIPHLPKLSSAVVQENDVKEQQVPISHIADYFMARKKTLKLNGFHWQRDYVPMPTNLPLVIRGYKTGNRDNMMFKEKCIGNRKGRKPGLSETCTTRKNMQSSAEGSASTNSNITGLDSSEVEDNLHLRQCNGPLITKFQTARTKVAARFQGGLGYAVDGGRSLNVKSVKSANSANSSSDSVARMKWTKCFVRKTVNRQQRPSATSLAEKGNTRTELEQDCSPCCANGITLDLELNHRSVSQAANCNVRTVSDTSCFEDNCVHNLETVNGEKGGDADAAAEVISKTTFQNPDGHNFCPVTPNCERYEGKLKQVIREPGSKHRQTKISSSVVTSLSKSSVKSYSNKISGKPACCGAVSKYSDKDSKVSSGASEDGRSEEHTFDLNQVLQERGASVCANTRVLLKCGAGHHNQKQPLKSSLKKSLDWRAHSQTTTVHLPKTGEQWSAACVNQTSDRSMKACTRTKLEPLYRSLSQTARDYVCSVPEESTQLCYEQKRHRKLRQNCHQPSDHCRRNVCNLELQTAAQQRLEQLCYYGTVEQGFGRNRDMKANANMHSNQFCQRENHTFQPDNESQHLQFPQPQDLIWCNSPSAKRTVEIFNSHGDEVPKITMTCPTPIPCRTPS